MEALNAATSYLGPSETAARRQTLPTRHNHHNVRIFKSRFLRAMDHHRSCNFVRRAKEVELGKKRNIDKMQTQSSFYSLYLFNWWVYKHPRPLISASVKKTNKLHSFRPTQLKKNLEWKLSRAQSECWSQQRWKCTQKDNKQVTESLQTQYDPSHSHAPFRSALNEFFTTGFLPDGAVLRCLLRVGFTDSRWNVVCFDVLF